MSYHQYKKRERQLARLGFPWPLYRFPKDLKKIILQTRPSEPHRFWVWVTLVMNGMNPWKALTYVTTDPYAKHWRTTVSRAISNPNDRSDFYRKKAPYYDFTVGLKVSRGTLNDRLNTAAWKPEPYRYERKPLDYRPNYRLKLKGGRVWKSRRNPPTEEELLDDAEIDRIMKITEAEVLPIVQDPHALVLATPMGQGIREAVPGATANKVRREYNFEGIDVD